MSRRNSPSPNRTLEDYASEKLPTTLDETIRIVQNLLNETDDFIVRRFQVFGRTPAALFYFSDLSNQENINQDILKPLMQGPLHLVDADIDSKRLKAVIAEEALIHGECVLSADVYFVLDAVLQGRAVVAVDGVDEAFVIGSPNVPKRSIVQPPTEQTIQGPREGFIEPLIFNLGLLRYRLPTPDLRIKIIRVGRITKSKVAVCYLEGIVNPDLVKEVTRRLQNIDIDGILDSGFLEQLIEDNHWSPFPQIQNTEKPDRAVGQMIEGRVVVLVDGSPFALICPTVFVQFYQSSEDYSSRFLQGSFSRLARVIALLFSLITPSLYVAIISFNPELIPTEFAIAVAGGRAGVPFPSVVEVLIMEISMEVLREATIRLPQQVGGALSIVGVLVIGQAAVSAGFASPITVVVIALTTIGSFATPAYNAAFALRMLRFPLIFLSGMFGLYGIVVGLILIGNHALSLKSFGVPYLTPAVPGNMSGLKDLLIRGPLWWMKKRPSLLQTKDDSRVGQRTVDNQGAATRNVMDPKAIDEQKEAKSDETGESDHGRSSDLDSR
ncbi:spore germination protein [Paenibacillus antri]|uniref:Spore germination protein n=1 Tax=Paenibacillus antri TaxID=2582848 RepID=A0A5R9G485_9BACL|nr:spore germination protein [Paenibacillus antri]TLS48318.1 spore germination protein [Paenibacillus antri]